MVPAKRSITQKDITDLSRNSIELGTNFYLLFLGTSQDKLNTSLLCSIVEMAEKDTDIKPIMKREL